MARRLADSGGAVSVLSDTDITFEILRDALVIEPFEPALVGPASYDVTLADEFVYVSDHAGPVVDLDAGLPEGAEWLTVEADSVIIPPNDMVLARTREWFALPNDMTASVEPRSTAARMGLVTDGWIDPGFEGTIMVEFSNTTRKPMKIRAGGSYCQFVFERTETPATVGYGDRTGSKYQGQNYMTTARTSATEPLSK